MVNESGAERELKVHDARVLAVVFVNPSAAPNPNGGYSYNYNFRPGAWIFGQTADAARGR